MNIGVGHITDVGRKRTANEDAYVVLLPPDTPTGVDAVLAVADGMGGHQAGEVASAMAVQAIVDRFGARPATNSQPRLSPGQAPTLNSFDEALRAAVSEANTRIVTEGQGDRRGMGTTLTVGLFSGNELHLAHVGDSRAYLLRNGGVSRVTEDHSWVADEVRAGRLSQAEAETHPRRNLLSRALGAEPSVEVDSGLVRLEDGDTILLCSDGLHGLVHDDEIASTVAKGPNLQAACERLMRLANERGGPDNITVVAARVGVGVSAPMQSTVSTLIRDKTLVPGKRRGWRRGWLRNLLPFGILLLLIAAITASVAMLAVRLTS